MTKNWMRQWVLCAMLAALTAVLAQIAVPIGPVPITLGMLAVFLSGALLGAKYGALSQLLYILLGAVGAPVFALFTGGIGILAGPTGGYLAGYLAAALVVGYGAERFGRRLLPLALFMVVGMLVCYLFGTLWYWFHVNWLSGTEEKEMITLWQAILACAIPFLPGEAVKIALAAVLTNRLWPVLGRQIRK